MADSRFETLNEEETAEVLNDKESNNTCTENMKRSKFHLFSSFACLIACSRLRDSGERN